MMFASFLLAGLGLVHSAHGQFDWDDTTPNTNVSAFATLWKFKSCNRDQTRQINQAFKDAAVLASQVAKDIDWNSIAAFDFFGPPAENTIARPFVQDNLARAAVYQPGWFDWLTNSYVEIHCDDPMLECSCGPETTVAYTVNDFPPNRYPMINLCPEFWNQRSLQDAMAFARVADVADLRKYTNQGGTFLHELMHIDYVGQPHVGDVSIKLGGVTRKAYGPLLTKFLARNTVGLDTATNADNYALFALSMYVQNQVGNYPHKPVLGRGFDDAAKAAMSDPVEDVSGDGCIAATGTIAPDPTVTPTAFWPDSSYPASYISQLQAWQSEAQPPTHVPPSPSAGPPAPPSAVPLPPTSIPPSPSAGPPSPNYSCAKDCAGYIPNSDWCVANCPCFTRYSVC
ncbi:hypothetical protein C8R43DRAFT_440354 [Mycena crocata]|nr:hypothetical protein C8R43DRAFT_440354 [Mycena crocata]